MGASFSVLGDSLGSSLGSSLGDLSGVDTIASLAGDSYRLEYDGESYVVGGLGAPDVVTLTNLQGDSDYDPTEATASEQPHSVDTLGLKAIKYVKTAKQFLSIVNASASVASTGDSVTLLVSARMDAVHSGTSYVFTIPNNASARMYFGFSSSGLRVLANTVSQGNVFFNTAYSDVTSQRVWRASLMSDRLALYQDGSLVQETVVATGGIGDNITGVTFCGQVGNSLNADATIFRAVLLTNPTAQQITDVEAYMIANPGVPA